jgi:hypothetical protein
VVLTDQAVRVEQSGPVTTVFLHRPARRNAVDGPTAAQLAAAFRAFDADPGAAVAVLHGSFSPWLAPGPSELSCVLGSLVASGRRRQRSP